MTNITIDKLFDQLDAWRHLPSYQLERRADIFFSLYLCEVLEEHFGFPINQNVIPEFPLLKAPKNGEPPTKHSNKIDYLALSADGTTAFFVELKTDNKSLNESQIEYLKSARDNKGMTQILTEFKVIRKASNAHGKYEHLSKKLVSVNLLPPSLRDEDTMTHGVKTIEIVFILPSTPKPGSKIAQDLEDLEAAIITYDQIVPVIARHDDYLSTRFNESLKNWASILAGGKQC